MRQRTREEKIAGGQIEPASQAALRQLDDQERLCTACGCVKPLTITHWKRKKGTKYGLMTVCRTCQQKARQRRMLDTIERGAVKNFLEKSTVGGPDVPHSAELLESILGYFGGTNGFSSLLLKQYWDSAPGSKMRTSILEMIVRLTSKNTDQGGARKPIDLYTEEEIVAEMDKRIQQQATLIVEGMTHADPRRQQRRLAIRSSGSSEDTEQWGHDELPEGGDLSSAERAAEEEDGGPPSLPSE